MFTQLWRRIAYSSRRVFMGAAAATAGVPFDETALYELSSGSGSSTSLRSPTARASATEAAGAAAAAEWHNKPPSLAGMPATGLSTLFHLSSSHAVPSSPVLVNIRTCLMLACSLWLAVIGASRNNFPRPMLWSLQLSA
jgi:hypothetical protein